MGCLSLPMNEFLVKENAVTVVLFFNAKIILRTEAVSLLREEFMVFSLEQKHYGII